MAKNQLTATKSIDTLLAEMHSGERLKRVLGPVSLTALGVGAIIGTGIFVLVGRVAADISGPSLMLSFVVAGLACVFAALCYAEFASMVPVAGSAYTYAYATLGELMAWIIGWDLILEYAVASATVAHGWSKYFQKLLLLFGVGTFAGPAEVSPTAPAGVDARLRRRAVRLQSCRRNREVHARPTEQRPKSRAAASIAPDSSSTFPPSSSPRSSRSFSSSASRKARHSTPSWWP